MGSIEELYRLLFNSERESYQSRNTFDCSIQKIA
uniref:Uncharacterized protein n=1 Tax=Utricularia reniformis TaxID=192314 RepID=A0A1Y0B422_9LAMI|nr:hypothetical protein AEK19_MT2000 [Utricularia reniformis]ART32162.1 hypothetical protein AEK19_MT2000 [Utricularia reniformis]